MHKVQYKMNDMKKNHLLLLFVFMAVIVSRSFAQDSTLFHQPDYKRNIVKWNMTPFLLWGKTNINLGFERMLSPYRSFSVNAGYFTLPSTGIYDSLSIENTSHKSGFTLSGDYRFYFKNRNKQVAPDGLYWGPFMSFHHYQFQNDVTVINSPSVQGNLLLDAGLKIGTFGVELGYQLAIKKRLTVDFIFLAPAVSVYNFNAKLKGDLTVDENDEYLQAIYDILVAKVPGLDKLIDEGFLNEKGVHTSFGLGLRYLIQIGYRF